MHTHVRSRLNRALFGERGPLLALSAKDKNTQESTTIDSFVPVKIDDKEYKKFKELFPATPPREVTQLAVHLAYLSTYVNSVLDGLMVGFYYAKSYDAGALGDLITTRIQENLSALDTPDGAPEKGDKTAPSLRTLATVATTFLNNLQRYSAFYAANVKDGVDLVYVGLRSPSSSAGISHRSHTQSSVPPFSTMGTNYASYRSSSGIDTEVGNSIMELALEIRKLLTGFTGATHDSYKRHAKDFSPVADFGTSLRTLLAGSSLITEHGVPVSFPAFNSPIHRGDLRPLIDLIKIHVYAEPDALIVNQKVKLMSDNMPDENMTVTKPFVAFCGATIRFTYSVHLRSEWVRFITQAEKGETPSLYALHVWGEAWSTAYFKPAGTRGGKNKGVTLRPSQVPMYVLPPSKSDYITKRRKELGFYTEKGRANSDDLMITSHGSLSWLPSADEHKSSAAEYEKTMNELLRLSFEAGSPLSSTNDPDKLFQISHPEFAHKGSTMRRELAEYCGSLQAYNWDLNTVISVSNGNPAALVSHSIAGSSKPQEINIAEYMRRPFHHGMREIFPRSRDLSPNRSGSVTALSFGDHEGIFQTSTLQNFIRFYTILCFNGLVSSPKKLMEDAAKSMDIKGLDDEKVADYELVRMNHKRTIYDVIAPNFETTRGWNLETDEQVPNFLTAMLKGALLDASAEAGTNLNAQSILQKFKAEESERYFDMSSSTLGELSNVYNYFGGRVFYMALKRVLAVPKQKLMEKLSTPQFIRSAETATLCQPMLFNHIANEVMPFVIMLGRVIPEKKEEVYKKADEQIENNKISKKPIDDLKVPGSRPTRGDKQGLQVFPHQADALSVLMNFPKYAVLDISAGGGKTSIILLEIANLYHNKMVKGPYFIVCPSGLIKNWVEDMHMHTEGKWNIIPVDSDVYNSWGDQKLTELIKSAPANTIVVIGNSFLAQTKKTQLVVGSSVSTVSNAVEFLKKFSPEYIALDESHRVRNTSSQLHKSLQIISTISTIKYARLATGTLISNVMSDAVGQATMFNGQVFRTKTEFDQKYMEATQIPGTDSFQMQYAPGSAMHIRERFSETVTIITKRRKEWAFMLPIPIERQYFVGLEKEFGDEVDVLGRAHKLMYETELRATLEELAKNTAILDLDKKTNRKGKQESVQDDDDIPDTDDENGEGKKESSDGPTNSSSKMGNATVDVTEDDEVEGRDGEALSEALLAALQPYLQRLETLIVDPFGDPKLLPLAKKFFGDGVDRDNFVSAKVRKVVELIEKHFNVDEWKKGESYSPSALVKFEGKTYVFRPDRSNSEPGVVTHTEPVNDEENWKQQDVGKVLVFCRYVRTVDAIYRALPDNLKKIALRYHGEVDNKAENLDQFKTNNKWQILIANEQGISEGHNLQMASRLIRVEAPWTPGELEQSAARIFRPDVQGKYKRQNIFLDWVITNGTLEICKLGRLVSKMLQKTCFDEAGNERYAGLNPLNLPVISMSLSNIAALNDVSQLATIGEGDTSFATTHRPNPMSYIGQHVDLTNRVAQEFREMKKTLPSKMIDIEPTPMPPDASVIEFTPWVANMRVPDRHDEGLLSMNALLEDEESELGRAIRDNNDMLMGKIVRTEFGYGKIIRINRTKLSRSVKESENADDFVPEISSVKIALSQGGEETVGISKVYMAQKVADKMLHRFDKSAPKASPAQQKKSREFDAQRDRVLKEVGERDYSRQKKTMKEAEKVVKTKTVPAVDMTMSSKPMLEIHAVIYNRMLAIEAITENPEDKVLKRYGFRKFGDYAWIQVKDKKNLYAILDFMETFTLPPKTITMFNHVVEAWQGGQRAKMPLELAPVNQIPLFYQQSHRMTKVTNRKHPEVVFWPVFVGEHMMIVVDLETNPIFTKYIGKSITGTTAKFQKADGLDLQMFKTKGELAAVAKKLAADFEITNVKEFKMEYEEIRTRLSKDK